jgi:N-acyl-D-amino-acid deacylase
MTEQPRDRPAPRRSDIIVRGAAVIDGTGAPRFTADVAIEDDRIVAVGDLGGTAAELEIEAEGRALAPGFIDTHAHDDRALLTGPDMTMKVSQGVTCVVIGNCGISLAPLTIEEMPPPPLNVLGRAADYAFPTVTDYVAELERRPTAINAACLVGHSTLRVGAMAELGRIATETELETMRERLREGMAAGAIGLSSGLFYPPAANATMEETAALAEVAGAAGGIYTAHIRDEGDDIAAALEEAFETGRRAGTPVVISHHKVAGARNFGRTIETLKLLDEARKNQAVAFDVYPYVAASTFLNPAYFGDCNRVTLTWSKAHPELAGRDIDDIAKEWGVSVEEAAERLQPAGAVYFLMDEADVRRVLSHPEAMIGSDGIPHDEHPHPRLWGTFPRVLGHYARDEELFDLEDAVRRMTGLPAKTFGFSDRGLVKPGYYADLVLFDPATVKDEATYEDPIRPSAGIELVMVNGEIVWRMGAHTNARPGRVLRRQTSLAA